MKRYVTAILCYSVCPLLMSLSISAVPAFSDVGSAYAGPSRLDVGNYNVRHGQGNDGVVDLDRIAEVLNGLDTQLIGLQELDYFNNRNNVDQAAEIAQRLDGDWQGRFYRSIDILSGEYGNGILYDAQVLSPLDERHLALPGAEERSAAIMLMEHANGKRFQFVTTHLTNRANEEDLRQQSMQAIYDNLFEGVPAIFAGDLNAEPDAPVFQDMIDHGWLMTTPLDEFTYPADDPTRTIDYMAVHHDGAFDVLSGETIDNELTRLASDHLPQVTRLHIIPEPGTAILIGAGGALLLLRRPQAVRSS